MQDVKPWVNGCSACRRKPSLDCHFNQRPSPPPFRLLTPPSTHHPAPCTLRPPSLHTTPCTLNHPPLHPTPCTLNPPSLHPTPCTLHPPSIHPCPLPPEFSTANHSIANHSTAQRSTANHRTAHRSTAQHSTACPPPPAHHSLPLRTRRHASDRCRSRRSGASWRKRSRCRPSGVYRDLWTSRCESSDCGRGAGWAGQRRRAWREGGFVLSAPYEACLFSKSLGRHGGQGRPPAQAAHRTSCAALLPGRSNCLKRPW
eukprot:365521-Chlamydomonas_euryale.AAC.6